MSPHLLSIQGGCVASLHWKIGRGDEGLPCKALLVDFARVHLLEGVHGCLLEGQDAGGLDGGGGDKADPVGDDRA